KPVTFHYKSDTTSTPQFGLIAEEVADVNPDLVVRDENGEIYTVRYEAVNAMLLNEFLKEHKKVGELEANAAHQQKQIEALTAGLQKVSAQLELSKSARKRCSIVSNGTVKHWEIIADRLSAAGWSWGWVSAVDSDSIGRFECH